MKEGGRGLNIMNNCVCGVCNGQCGCALGTSKGFNFLGSSKSNQARMLAEARAKLA